MKRENNVLSKNENSRKTLRYFCNDVKKIVEQLFSFGKDFSSYEIIYEITFIMIKNFLPL